MPQANITYDTPYNKDLVAKLKEMDKKLWTHNYDAYHPTPLGYRSGDAFHDPKKQKVITGGVAPMKYVLSGNSPAYPPVSMNAGLAVHSGGARGYAGMDGAVGGKWGFADLTKGLSTAIDVGKQVKDIYDVAKPLLGKGRGRKAAVKGGFKMPSLKSIASSAKDAVALAKTGKDAYDLYKSFGGVRKVKALERKMVGGNWLSDALDVAKQIAPLALPLMMGAGKAIKTDADKVALVEAAMKQYKGGSFWSDFGKGFKEGFTGTLDVAKQLAPIALPLMLGAGKAAYGKKFNMGKFLEKKGGAIVGAYLGADGQVHLGDAVKKARGGKKAVKGGISLKDVIDSAKRMGSKAIDVVKKRGKKALKDLGKDVLDAAKKSALKSAEGAVAEIASGAGRGRAARAAIVKKVMKDRGISMIAASKAVKAEGLY